MSNIIINGQYGNSKFYFDSGKGDKICINKKKLFDLSNCSGVLLFGHNSNIFRKTLNDFKRKLEDLVPSDSYYEHDDWDLRTENMQEDENVNGRSHVRGSIIGSTAITLPIVDAEMIIGRWQRLFFVELDCARPRRLFIQIQDIG